MSENIETIFTKGTLKCIMNNGIIQDPVFQVIEIKRLSDPERIDRYILTISDSLNFYQYVVLTTNLNHLISSGLNKYAIIQLKNYVINIVTEPGTNIKKKVLVILDLIILVLGESVRVLVGEPTAVYIHHLIAGISNSIMTAQTFEVHELLKDITIR